MTSFYYYIRNIDALIRLTCGMSGLMIYGVLCLTIGQMLLSLREKKIKYSYFVSEIKKENKEFIFFLKKGLCWGAEGQHFIKVRRRRDIYKVIEECDVCCCDLCNHEGR